MVRRLDPSETFRKRVGGLLGSAVGYYRPSARAVLVLSSGAVGGHAVTLIAWPAITRVFSPAELGQLGLYLAFFSVAVAVGSLQYHLAMVSAADEAEAVRILILCSIIAPATAFLSAGVFAALVLIGAAQFDSFTLWLTPVVLFAVLCGAYVVVLRYWAIWARTFRQVATNTVLQSVTRSGFQIALGIAGLGVVGLVVGDAIGRLAGIRPLAAAPLRAMKRNRRSINPPALTATARKYWRFPLLSGPSSLLDALGTALPAPLIAAYFGIGPAGLFVLAQRLLILPAAVLGGAVADVFHVRLAEEVERGAGEAQRLIWRTSTVLLAVGAIIALAVIAAGGSGFSVMFGEEWEPAGAFAAALLPWTLAQLATSPVSRTVFVLGRQSVKFIYDIASVMVTFLTLTVASLLGADAVTAVLALSVGNAITYAVYMLLIWRMAGRADRRHSHMGEI